MKNPILPLLFSSRGTHIPCFPRSPTRNPVLREDQISINMGNFHLAALKSRALRPQKNYKITKLQNYNTSCKTRTTRRSEAPSFTTIPNIRDSQHFLYRSEIGKLLLLAFDLSRIEFIFGFLFGIIPSNVMQIGIQIFVFLVYLSMRFQEMFLATSSSSSSFLFRPPSSTVLLVCFK
jgi:hypothetical protein